MKSIKYLAALCLLALATAPAIAASGRNHMAEDPSTNMYLGLSMGNLNTDFPNANNPTPSLSSSFSSALFMGATFNRNLSGEITYTNLGIIDLGATTKLKGSAYSMSVLGILPVSDSFELIAKLGFAITGAYLETNHAPGGTQTMVAPTYGVGIMANINSRTDIRFSYENFKFTTNNTDTYNANMVTLSVLFHF